MGVPWNESLVRDIEAETGRTAATAMTAVTDALTWLGARRVSVATPYGPGKNTYTRAYLEAAGFEVAVIDGWNAPSISIRDLKAIPEGAPLELGRRVFAADTDTDALFVPCAVWSVCPYIAPLEQATGVPLLTILNTVVWRGLHELGHPGGVTGYGRRGETKNLEVIYTVVTRLELSKLNAEIERIDPRAFAAPIAHAHCLPNQSFGSGGGTMTRSRGSRAAMDAAIAPVSSVEWSSTTMTSSRG